MKIYWSNKDLPELANLTPKQRGQAWKACYFRYAFKYWQTWAALIGVGVLTSLGGIFGRTVGAAIGAGLGGFIFGQVAMQVVRPHLRDYVENELRQ